MNRNQDRKTSLSWSPVTESNRRPSPYHACWFRRMPSDRVGLPQARRISVSGYVALCRPLPGAVVTYLVTGSRTFLPPNARSPVQVNSKARYDHGATTGESHTPVMFRAACSAAAFTTSGTLVPGSTPGTSVQCQHDPAVDRRMAPAAAHRDAAILGHARWPGASGGPAAL